jgi:hypothetical protein
MLLRRNEPTFRAKLGKSLSEHIESASPPKSGHQADMPDWPVRATTGLMHRSKCILFDHLVGGREQYPRHSDPECLGSPEIDHQIEFGRPLDGQIARLLAL